MRMTYREMFTDNWNSLLEQVGTNQPLRTGKQFVEVEFRGMNKDLSEECEVSGSKIYNVEGTLVYRQHRVAK